MLKSPTVEAAVKSAYQFEEPNVLLFDEGLFVTRQAFPDFLSDLQKDGIIGSHSEAVNLAKEVSHGGNKGWFIPPEGELYDILAFLHKYDGKFTLSKNPLTQLFILFLLQVKKRPAAWTKGTTLYLNRNHEWEKPFAAFLQSRFSWTEDDAEKAVQKMRSLTDNVEFITSHKHWHTYRIDLRSYFPGQNLLDTVNDGVEFEGGFLWTRYKKVDGLRVVPTEWPQSPQAFMKKADGTECRISPHAASQWLKRIERQDPNKTANLKKVTTLVHYLLHARPVIRKNQYKQVLKYKSKKRADYLFFHGWIFVLEGDNLKTCYYKGEDITQHGYLFPEDERL